MGKALSLKIRANCYIVLIACQALFNFCTHVNSFSPQHSSRRCVISTPLLQMRKLRHRELSNFFNITQLTSVKTWFGLKKSVPTFCAVDHSAKLHNIHLQIYGILHFSWMHYIRINFAVRIKLKYEFK